VTAEEVVETLNHIIRLQSDVISELFLLLGQHIAAQELDSLPVIEKINLAAEMRMGIDRGRWMDGIIE